MISDFDRAIQIAHKTIAESASDLEQHKDALARKENKSNEDWTRISFLQISIQVLLAEATKISQIKDVPSGKEI